MISRKTSFHRQEVVNNEKQSFCEGQLTSKECLEAIKNMTAGKSPDTDGLPCEFYLVFWKDIGETLTNALFFLMKQEN